MLRRFLLTALLVVLTCFATAANANDEPVYVERGDEELFIFDLVLDRYLLEEAMICYYDKDSLLIPIGVLFSAIGYSIEVDVEQGVAEGFFLNETNYFKLDLLRNELTLNGERRTLDGRGYELHYEDIYLSAWLIEQWFPLKLNIQSASAGIYLNPTQPLPLQQRLDRENLNNRKLRARGGGSAERYPAVETPYKWLSAPVMDISITGNYGPKHDEPFNYGYSLLGSHDLALATSELFYSGQSSSDKDSYRYHLYRKQDLPGLTPDNFDIGDIYSRGLELISNPGQGVGVEISNTNLGIRSNQFDTTTIQGNAVPGSDVELYANGMLVGYKIVGDDGLYLFDEVPIRFGNNFFETVVYDPYGRRKRITQRYLVGPGMVKPGQSRYRVGHNEIGNQLFEEKAYHRHSFLELHHGFSRSLSGRLSLSSLTLDDGNDDYLGLELNNSADGYYHSLYGVVSADGGAVARYALKGQYYGVGYDLTYRKFDRYQSLAMPLGESGYLDSQVNYSVQKAFEHDWLPTLYLSLGNLTQTYDSGFSQNVTTFTLNTSLAGVSIRNGITSTRQGSAAPTRLGKLDFSGFVLNTSIRSSFDYDLTPQRKLKKIEMSIERTLADNLNAAAKITHSKTLDETSYQLGLRHSLKNHFLAVTGNMGYDQRNGVSLNVGISFSLNAGSPSSRTIISSEAQARNGAVFARLCRDDNGDKRCNEDEPPLEGVSFDVNGNNNEYASNSHGYAQIANVTPYQNMKLVINEGTVNDPDLISVYEGKQLTPRPGTISIIEFPLIPSGEIDGTIFSGNADSGKALAKVLVQLVDGQDRVIQESGSAYDGFYLFTRVPYGEYSVRIAPQQQEAFGVTANVETVTIGGEEPFISGIDLYLNKNEGES